MKLSLNWLKEYVDIPVSPEELSEKLLLSGTAVDSFTKLGDGIDNVVVGQVEKIEKHPNADRLSVAQVNIGVKKIQVVFGDKAVVKVGDKVPTAVAPAKLPKGEIKHTEFRGVQSEGMLCLMSELKEDLATELTYFSKDVPVGEQVQKALGWNDIIFELALTPNRGDCLSALGIAREVSAFFQKPLKRQVSKVTYPIENERNKYIHIAVQDHALCPKFCALYMRDVRVGKSPQWLARRLEAVGIRSISNVVDVTNYIMLDLGQPIHAFDAVKVSDQYIIVRNAKNGEKLITLDGKMRALDESILVLADTKKALDIAGVMGGMDTEVTEETKDIILVASMFDPSVIRRAYRKLGIRTEAAIRFEKGIDWYNLEPSLQKTADMIQDVGGGTVSKSIVKVAGKDPRKIEFDVRLDFLNTLLGYDIKETDIKATLAGLGIKISYRTKNVFTVLIPSWRHDITIPADIAEEIGRMRDYNTIPPVPLNGVITPPPINQLYEVKQSIRALLVSAGYNEVYTYSYYGKKETAFSGGSAKHVEIENPISPDEQYLRRSLIQLLLRKASSNLRLFDEIKIFELGTVFEPDAVLPKERTMLAGVVSYKGAALYDLYRRIKGHLEYLFTELGVIALSFKKENNNILINCDGTDIGWIRVIRPDDEPEYKFRQNIAMFECAIVPLLSQVSKRPRFEPIPMYPSVTRDINFIVPDPVRYIDVLKIAEKSSPLLSSVALSDEFRLADGRRSITLRFVYASSKKTLTGSEVDSVSLELTALLKSKLHFELRT